jgi:DNA-binding LacI/PurR family transcriptional regulator
MAAAGLSTEGLATHPVVRPSQDHEERVEAARATARALAARHDLTAIITADLLSAHGLFLCLQDLEIPPPRWPAVLSFGYEAGPNGHLVTVLRGPWDEVGRNAADLLWERSHGRITGPPVERRVPMRLIPRLTCRPEWGALAGHALLGTTKGQALAR